MVVASPHLSAPESIQTLDPGLPSSAFSQMFLQLHIVTDVEYTSTCTSARGHIKGTVLITCSIQSLYQFMLRLKISEGTMFDHAACNQHSCHWFHMTAAAFGRRHIKHTEVNVNMSILMDRNLTQIPTQKNVNRSYPSCNRRN